VNHITENDIGEILDLFIDEKITDFNPNPSEFQAAISQLHNRYLREHATDENKQ